MLDITAGISRFFFYFESQVEGLKCRWWETDELEDIDDDICYPMVHRCVKAKSGQIVVLLNICFVIALLKNVYFFV